MKRHLLISSMDNQDWILNLLKCVRRPESYVSRVSGQRSLLPVLLVNRSSDSFCGEKLNPDNFSALIDRDGLPKVPLSILKAG